MPHQRRRGNRAHLAELGDVVVAVAEIRQREIFVPPFPRRPPYLWAPHDGRNRNNRAELMRFPRSRSTGMCDEQPERFWAGACPRPPCASLLGVRLRRPDERDVQEDIALRQGPGWTDVRSAIAVEIRRGRKPHVDSSSCEPSTSHTSSSPNTSGSRSRCASMSASRTMSGEPTALAR